MAKTLERAALDALKTLDEDSRAYGTYDYVAKSGVRSKKFWKAYRELADGVTDWQQKVVILEFLTSDDGRDLWQ